MGKSAKGRVVAFNCPNCGAAVAPDEVSCCYCGSAIAAAVCPSCFGAVSVGMKHCPACGANVEPAKPESANLLKCPRCETDLSVIPVGRYSAYECLQCGGLWVGKAAFQSICTQQEEQEAVLGFGTAVQVSSRSRKGRRRAYIPCPECGKLMNQKNFSGCSGVVLDWCREHGAWFDRRELQRIVSFIRCGGLRKARERERAELWEEKERMRARQFDLAVRSAQDDTSIMDRDPLMQFLSRLF